MPNIELSKAARADPGLLASLQPLLDQVAGDHADRPDLVQVFSDALTITLATTVRPFAADGTTFVATGDIAAMWLRDSSAQVETYLRVAEHNPDLRRVLEGVTRRQAAFVAVDPYANAFNEQPADGHHGTDTPQPGPWVWERKYELDSLCYPIRFAYGLWTKGKTTDHLTADVRAMFATIVEVMRTEQDHEARSQYRFQRETTLATETLTREGKGAPTAPTGMVWSGFRPSDDACTYGFLVPANMFAVVSLGQLAEMLREVYDDSERGGRGRPARRRDPRGDRDTRCRRPSGVRPDLRLRGRRSRQSAPLRRRQHPEPALGPLPRLLRGRRSHLPRHPCFRSQQGQSLLLRGQPGSRDRQPAHLSGLDLADGAHHAGHHGHGRRRGACLRRHAA